MISDTTFDDLDGSALLALVGSEEREGRRLEFKSALPGRTDKERREMVADATSLANTAGGWLLYGVDEEEGRAVAVPGVDGDPDAAVVRLESMLRDGTEPRLTGVRTRAVRAGDDGPHVIAMLVPRSWSGPHRATGTGRFHGRSSAGKYELDVRELGALFRQGDEIVARVRRLHRERVTAVEAGDAPLPGMGTPLTMLTVVPFPALTDAVVLPLFDDDRLRRGVGTFGGSATHMYPVLEGVLGAEIDGLGANRGYGLLHRTGFVEHADRWLIGGHLPEERRIAGAKLEGKVVELSADAVSVLLHAGLGPPFAVQLTLLGVRHHTYNVSRGVSGGFSRDVVDPPPVLVEDVPQDVRLVAAHVSRALRPLLDAVANAAGLPRSPNYDSDGNRTR